MKKSTFFVSVSIALLTGFVIGGIVGIPPTLDGLSGGDISKVNKYQKATVSPQLSAYQEKLLNDSIELKKAVSTLAILGSRINEFDKLLELAIRSSENKPSLELAVNSLQGISAMSKNACNSVSEAAISFESLISNKPLKNAIAYDQASQNASLAFLLMERQVNQGKQFVKAADEYLEANGINGNEDLALARDLWKDYCYVDAIMNADKNETEYWASVSHKLNKEQFGLAYAEYSNLESIKVNSVIDCIVAAEVGYSYPLQVFENGISAQATDVIGSVFGQEVALNPAITNGTSEFVNFAQAICSFNTEFNGIVKSELANGQNELGISQTELGISQTELGFGQTELGNSKTEIVNFIEKVGLTEMISNGNGGSINFTNVICNETNMNFAGSMNNNIESGMNNVPGR